MRRQQRKHEEKRGAPEVEANLCRTLDLQNVRLNDRPCGVGGFMPNKRNETTSKSEIPYLDTPEISSSASSGAECEECSDLLDKWKSTSEMDRVLRVLQPLSFSAQYRLHRLGGLDLAKAVPSFVYRVFRAEKKRQYSGDATAGSAGGNYQRPRVLQRDSNGTHPRQPTYYYI
ncbi:unnamed protein product [Hyaloperonospora brassicae]|uniref:Uncharacterized protein n=1 Tax=Hyaloperonospora brassicae TaxID=162125 RepID=A0AAV0U1E5_HYABA|nr:unnamed protein product [Hyaloperonospora brassicae]